MLTGHANANRPRNGERHPLRLRVARVTLERHLIPSVRRPRHLRTLSDREEEVTKLVAESHTSEEIARILNISPRTVDRHRENILAKLGMRDRVELTRWAIRHGLVEP